MLSMFNRYYYVIEQKETKDMQNFILRIIMLLR